MRTKSVYICVSYLQLINNDYCIYLSIIYLILTLNLILVVPVQQVMAVVPVVVVVAVAMGPGARRPGRPGHAVWARKSTIITIFTRAKI